MFRFANYYQDHMVLQRAPQQAIVWGYADSLNTLISLTINDEIYHTRSYASPKKGLADSAWSVTLDPQTEEGPFQVKVTRPLVVCVIDIFGHDHDHDHEENI